MPGLKGNRFRRYNQTSLSSETLSRSSWGDLKMLPGQSSIVVLETGLGLNNGLEITFNGLGLVSDSTAFVLSLVLISDIFYVETSQNHNGGNISK